MRRLCRIDKHLHQSETTDQIVNINITIEIIKIVYETVHHTMLHSKKVHFLLTCFFYAATFLETQRWFHEALSIQQSFPKLYLFTPIMIRIVNYSKYNIASHTQYIHWILPQLFVFFHTQIYRKIEKYKKYSENHSQHVSNIKLVFFSLILVQRAGVYLCLSSCTVCTQFTDEFYVSHRISGYSCDFVVVVEWYGTTHAIQWRAHRIKVTVSMKNKS